MLPPAIYQDGFEATIAGLWNKHWVTVYQDLQMNASGIAICSFLVDAGNAGQYLERADWYEDISRSRPGFSQYGYGDEMEVEYHRFSARHEGEPLVLVRHFIGGFPKKPEIAEELRLMFNLYPEPDGSGFSEIDEQGEKHRVTIVAEEGVQITKPLLRRYMAARQKALVINVLSDVWEDWPSGEHIQLPEGRSLKSGDMHFEYWASNISFTSQISSRWLGQKIILPPPLEECGVWPFELKPEYESFIVGVDDRGKYVLHTCDPDELPSGPFAQRDEPDRLTPIFFKKEVLAKYFQDSGRYEVGPGLLRNRDIWLLRIDNNHPSHVAVFLGDLGTDLPYSEQKYWRAFNVPREGRGISDAAFRTSILGEAADADRIDHRFKRAYATASAAWTTRYGFPLFKELHSDDRHVLAGLRLMLTDSTEEFDTLELKLAKLLVDSLNDEAIASALGGPLRDEKSIARFERYLSSLGYPAVARDLMTVRTVQGVRSKGPAHRRGGDFDLAKAGLNPVDLPGSFQQLLSHSITMLDTLIEFAGGIATSDN